MDLKFGVELIQSLWEYLGYDLRQRLIRKLNECVLQARTELLSHKIIGDFR